MVKHIKTNVLFIMTALLFLVGCSNISTNSSYNNKDGTASETGDISIFLSEQQISRLLAPETLKIDTAEIKKYYLAGESLLGYKTEAFFDVDDIKNNSAKLEGIKYDDWNFTLYACSDTAGTVYLLKGTAFCAMKSAAQSSVTFTLSSYDVATAGNYSITVKYTDTAAWKTGVYSFTWGIYNSITGAKVNESSIDKGTDADKIIDENGFTAASASPIAPGQYIFGVTIYNGATKLGYASDILIIEPGRTTTKEFNIGKIIMTAPDAPANLKAQRIVDSADSTDYYTVRFYWEDKSYNETKFEFIVREFTDTSTEWEALAADATVTEGAAVALLTYGNVLTLDGSTTTYNTLADSLKYVAGSLYAGSTELVLKFPTGRLFDAQIRAVNGIGTSASCVRVGDETGTSSDQSLESASSGAVASATKTTTSNFTTTSSKTNLANKYVVGYKDKTGSLYHRINLVKISYNLNGGVMKYPTDATAVEGKTFVEYKVYELDTSATATADTNGIVTSADDKYIKLIQKGTGGFASLIKDGVEFTEWHAFLTRVDTKVLYNVNGYQNITVSAVYGQTSGDVDITNTEIEPLPVLDDARVVAYYGDDVSSANTEHTVKGGTITIPRGGKAKYVTVGVNVPQTATDTTFTKYRLFVNGIYAQEIVASSSDVSYFGNFSTDSLVNGVETEVLVVGITKSGKMASSKFYIQLNN